MKKQENLVLTKLTSIMVKLKTYQLITSLLIAILIYGCTGIHENGKDIALYTRPHINEISDIELNLKIENMEDFFLIDVRQPEEFEKGNIPYSILIPRGILEFKIGDEKYWEEQEWFVPNKDSEIIIYCLKGDRGILATKSLMELGYSNVKNLKGGISKWDPEFSLGSDTPEVGGCGG